MLRPFPRLTHPIVQAPMAGGPSTPLLAATVSNAGGLGFLAAGYRTAAELRAEIATVREQTAAQFGVNLFLLDETPVDSGALSRYAQALRRGEGDGPGTLGTPRFDDDALDAKLGVVFAERPEIVSFTFGCPPGELVARLHERGISVWITVTEPEEALAAAAVGADAVIAQGVEAGGHRGSFSDLDGHGELSLIPLLRLT
ncbi:MAG: nitronate monooxygenase, partial [Solirubrobacteraceae bacterium]